MTLELRDCTFAGPAMPEPFVKYRLEELLTKKKLLAKATGEAGKKLQESWQVYRNKLRSLGEQGLEQRVLNYVLEPLVERLGWQVLDKADSVTTREGREDGGYLLRTPPAEGEGGAPHLRAWVYPVGTDLDAPNKRGRAYRFSPGLVAQRVLLAKGERVGLLTDGLELRILLSDPSGRDSHIGIRLDRSGGWRASREVPDSFRLLKALCQPSAAGVIGDLLNEARLSQSSVTKKLREQARRAVEMFIQGLLDDPANGEVRNRWSEDDEAANELWREGLVLVYRLLFILKLETSPDPARAFSFASSSLWRNSYSPSTALAPVVEKVRDHGAETGEFLGHSLRALFRLFSHGLSTNELHVSPLGGMLFGKEATPILDSLHWSEQTVAHLLDALLWTPADKKLAKGGEGGRERVHYGALDVEDLGRVYEALLELEPGIAGEPMCRLRRAKLEVVVPVAQGAPYRTDGGGEDADGEESEDEEEQDEEKPGKGKTKVLFIEEIPEGRFYLRVGLGRKASGSYYTPHPFVRFLVQETLGTQVVERSPQEDPNPRAILGLKVLDPAMGSGHFLVEACRFLGDALYEACRLCDERALEAQKKADSAKSDGEREKLLGRARNLWKRVEDLPDPNDELVAYLPSRVLEGEESGLSQRKALALCRRLVAVHSLYGVDKNPLAVELARVSLWLESYAEGLPLTFLEHRLVCGDSLTGPFFEHLLTYPGTGERINNLFAQGVTEKLTKVLVEALVHIRDLEATIGKDAADIELKKIAKTKLDAALSPLKVLAAAWAGGVLLGKDACDDAGYENMLRAIAEREDPDAPASSRPGVAEMVRVGMEGVPYDLIFPEVFYPQGRPERSGGFHCVVGNPPWDTVRRVDDQFFAGFDFRAMVGGTKRDKLALQQDLLARPNIRAAYAKYCEHFQRLDRICDALFTVHKARIGERLAGRGSYDAFMLFTELAVRLGVQEGAIGLVLPSSLYVNEGATGTRRLIFNATSLRYFLAFSNAKGLFEVHRQTKFVLLVARKTGAPTGPFEAFFNAVTPEILFEKGHTLSYDRELVTATGGEHLAVLEASDERTLRIARTLYAGHKTVEEWFAEVGMELSQEVNMTYDDALLGSVTGFVGDLREPANRELALATRRLILHEGKTFHQYTDRWPEARVRALLHLDDPGIRPAWKENARYFRLAIRDVTNAENERTAIAAILPPCFVGNTALVEVSPANVPHVIRLTVLAVLNSFAFDWCARLKVTRHLNKFILNALPVPPLSVKAQAFVARMALELTASSAGFDELRGQVLNDGRSREAVHGEHARASVDVVVAHAFGLSRDQYEQVLACFSHKSDRGAPARCLAAFDELNSLGLDAFVKKHDPCWDIPLVTTLPKPITSFDGHEKIETFVLTPPDGRTPGASAEPLESPDAPWLSLSATDRAVLLLARTLKLHQLAGPAAVATLGEVKAEKILHVAEAHLGIDLEREPTRLAAGPADFSRLKKVLSRAEKRRVFRVESRKSGGHAFVALAGLPKRSEESTSTFAPLLDRLDAILKEFVRFDTDRAEIVATLYASWNDLVAGGCATPSDDAIIKTFYAWSSKKAAYERSRLEKALQWMRDHQLVPSGRARLTPAAVPKKAAVAAPKKKTTARRDASKRKSRAMESGD